MVEFGMKLDGRTLDHATLEQIRLMAMKRVREGEEPATVIASYGFCRTTIYKWMKLTAGRGHGLKALSSTRGSGRPRRLTAAQERQVFAGSMDVIRANTDWTLDCGRARSWLS